jgi:DNA repair protein SbcC/Rad50
MIPQLDTLTIANFRSIKGTINVPLNAPIILIHGLNGTGKTSLLSALELALTGDIAAMRRDDPNFAQHLVHQGAKQATILFSGSGIADDASPTVIESGIIRQHPILDAEDAKFFTERCFLAQSVLGRLLEIYSRSDPNTDSALTRFVKDLLRLDELDALIEGLNDAGHLARTKNLVPLLRRADDLRKRYRIERDEAATRHRGLLRAGEQQLTELRRLVADVALDHPVNQVSLPDLSSLRSRLAHDAEEERLTVLMERKRELNALARGWADLPAEADAAEREDLEAKYEDATETAEAWRTMTGGELERLTGLLRSDFPDLPSWSATDPETARSQAERRVSAEIARLDSAIERERTSQNGADNVAAELARAQSRKTIVDDQFRAIASDASALARALAQIVPHIHSEDCPVCGRDFREVNRGTLQGHVQRRVAALTEQAGRLSALAVERSEVETAIAALVRQQESISATRIGAAALLDLQSRLSRFVPIHRQLQALKESTAQGSALIGAESLLRGRLGELRDRDRRSNDLRSALEALGSKLGESVASSEAFLSAVSRVSDLVDARNNELSRARQVRSQALAACYELVKLRSEAASALERQETAQRAFDLADQAFRDADALRANARSVADTARTVRTSIVVRVFNEALNALWRDLFVRLAPTEPFVPAFHLPATADGVVAQLETRMRSGEKGGTPGAMLSAGNLNTAALTLFLALHLSVEAKLPWLVLDDPVQSMDEVHISQFAALLRTLSKYHGRKIIIAVHERPLFEYLRLELSPAFADDRLITVELRRSASEETIAASDFLPYEGEDVVAA